MSLSHSIVIPVHGRSALTRRCLDALLGQPECAAAEIVVVDDGSPDEIREVVAAFGERVRLIQRPEQGGFAEACNLGARSSNGEAIVFLNNDTLPREGWLSALLGYASSVPGAAAVGSRLLNPDGTIQHAAVVFCQDGFPRHLYSGLRGDHPAVSRSARVSAVSAACLLVRRGAFEELGGFDEGFVNGLEDVDLCLRLAQGGYEIHYCADSVVEHLESASRAGRSAEMQRGLKRFQERWGSRIRPDDVDRYLADGLLQLRYRDSYPLELTVSPELAAILDDGRELEANRLLSLRARQSFELLREVVRLAVLASGREPTASLPHVPPLADRPDREPAGGSLETDHPAQLRALLADAHDQLRRRDEELAGELHELQRHLFRGSRDDGAASASARPGPTPGDRLGYPAVRHRLAALVADNLPEQCTVLVVSKGDEELLSLGRRRAWHFPRDREGRYPGHYPETGAAAIAHLEELRELGGEFLVFPETARWWLDHYAGLRAHLEGRYREVASVTGTGTIFALDRVVGSSHVRGPGPAAGNEGE